MENFLNLIAQEKNSDAKDYFGNIMNEKICQVLENKKREIASSLFNNYSESVED